MSFEFLEQRKLMSATTSYNGTTDTLTVTDNEDMWPESAPGVAGSCILYVTDESGTNQIKFNQQSPDNGETSSINFYWNYSTNPVSKLIINTGDGEDEVISSLGSTLGGLGLTLEVHGGAYSDTVVSGASTDKIYGDSLNDYIDTGDGNDSIYGGTGDDSINGGNGNDTLYGEDGVDTLSGYVGNDYIYGGNGNDSIDGGSNSDTLNGDAGNDTVDGGNSTGNDVISGGTEADTLIGGSGADNIQGGDGNDFLYAYVIGNNNDGYGDTLLGQNGTDSLFGTSGQDTLTV